MVAAPWLKMVSRLTKFSTLLNAMRAEICTANPSPEGKVEVASKPAEIPLLEVAVYQDLLGFLSLSTGGEDEA